MHHNTSEPNVVALKTTFGGRPAPGGLFNTENRHYWKLCKHRNAGRHPHRDALGGIDEPVLEELHALDCQAIWLELADGRRYHCPFGVFAAYAFKVDWKDVRFPPRYYLGESYWEEC